MGRLVLQRGFEAHRPKSSNFGIFGFLLSRSVGQNEQETENDLDAHYHRGIKRRYRFGSSQKRKQTVKVCFLFYSSIAKLNKVCDIKGSVFDVSVEPDLGAGLPRAEELAAFGGAER